MAGPFSFEGKTINAANNHDGTNVGGDIITSNSTMKGTSADYLTARLKSVSDAIELARAKKEKGKTGPKINGDSIKYEQGTTNENILRRLARDHEDILAKFREAMKAERGGDHTTEEGKARAKRNNITDCQESVTGTSKDYTCERLRRYRHGQ